MSFNQPMWFLTFQELVLQGYLQLYDDGYYLSLFHLQVIAVNGEFPGTVINVTTNYNVMVNVRNKLDEDLLVTW